MIKKFDIFEADLDSLLVEVANTPHPHSVRGLGIGSRDAQEKHSVSDLNWKGLWMEELVDIGNGFIIRPGDVDSGILVPLAQSAYNEKQNDLRYRAVGALDIVPNPGDYVNLYTLDAPKIPKFLQIQNVELSPTRKLTLDLGVRKQDEIDAFNAKKDLASVYTDAYITSCAPDIYLSGSLTIGDYNHGWGTPYNTSFTIPANVADAGNNHRVTADLSVRGTAGAVSTAKCNLFMAVAGGINTFSGMLHYLLNDFVTGIDITNLVNYGSSSAVVVQCQLSNANWVGGGALPTGSVSLTIHSWRRILRA